MTLVFHDQTDSIAEAVTGHEAKLAGADLPNIPFHSEPLMNGHKDYEFLGIEQRKVMLAYFSSFVRRLPIPYVTFVYRRSQFEDPARPMERMGRDIPSAMVEHLGFFQPFDDVKVYYDNGQDIVKQALDRSVGKVLSKGVVRRRRTSMTDYRLEQVADYLCTIELALVKYEAKEDGETYNKFFGGIGSFGLAQASPQQADMGGSAAPQGTVTPPPSAGRRGADVEPRATYFEQRKLKRKQKQRWH
ncbi:MAG: hypothetical protein SPG07_04135 [Coriobacteriales bacterium]|nr:hypothetical protein [Coriobacteriales bacterium]